MYPGRSDASTAACVPRDRATRATCTETHKQWARLTNCQTPKRQQAIDLPAPPQGGLRFAGDATWRKSEGGAATYSRMQAVQGAVGTVFSDACGVVWCARERWAELNREEEGLEGRIKAGIKSLAFLMVLFVKKALAGSVCPGTGFGIEKDDAKAASGQAFSPQALPSWQRACRLQPRAGVTVGHRPMQFEKLDRNALLQRATETRRNRSRLSMWALCQSGGWRAAVSCTPLTPHGTLFSS